MLKTITFAVTLGFASGACHTPQPAEKTVPSITTKVVASEPPGNSPTATKPVSVPKLGNALKFDGELGETDWHNAGRSGPFVDLKTGKEAHPYSEARFLWDNQNLYVGLYAADQDIRTDATKQKHDALGKGDAFNLRFRKGHDVVLSLDISPTGVLADASQTGTAAPDPSWESNTKLAVDHDGTLNDSSDEDEEWVIEAAIPLDSLGLKPEAGASIEIVVSRCDQPKKGPEVCGNFGHDGAMARLVLDATVASERAAAQR